MSDVVVIPDDDPAPDPATAPVIVPVTVVTGGAGDGSTEAVEEAAETAEAAAEIAFATADALMALSARVDALETAPPAVVEIEETAPAPEPVAPSTVGENPVDEDKTPPKKTKKALKDSGWFKGRK